MFSAVTLIVLFPRIKTSDMSRYLDDISVTRFHYLVGK